MLGWPRRGAVASPNEERRPGPERRSRDKPVVVGYPLFDGGVITLSKLLPTSTHLTEGLRGG